MVEVDGLKRGWKVDGRWFKISCKLIIFFLTNPRIVYHEQVVVLKSGCEQNVSVLEASGGG